MVYKYANELIQFGKKECDLIIWDDAGEIIERRSVCFLQDCKESEMNDFANQILNELNELNN